jgi:hypothetical protein
MYKFRAETREENRFSRWLFPYFFRMKVFLPFFFQIPFNRLNEANLRWKNCVNQPQQWGFFA